MMAYMVNNTKLTLTLGLQVKDDKQQLRFSLVYTSIGSIHLLLHTLRIFIYFKLSSIKRYTSPLENCYDLRTSKRQPRFINLCNIKCMISRRSG